MPDERTRVPIKARLAAVGLSAATGGAGSYTAGRLVPGRYRRLAETVAGSTSAAASLPLTNRLMRHVGSGYEVTPAGVRRKKTLPVRPSSRANVIETRGTDKRRARAAIVPSSVGKLASYPGQNISPGRKRAAIYASGALPIPLVNDVASAETAARLGPPEQRRRTFTTQLGSTWAGSAAGGVGGGYGAHRLIQGSPGRAQGFQNAHHAVQVAQARTNQSVRRVLGIPAREGPKKVTAAAEATGRVARRLGIPKVGAAVVTGAVLGQVAGGNIGSQLGTTANLARERKRNAMINKSMTKLPSPVDESRQLKRKKRSARLTATSGALGLTSLGLLPRHPQTAFKVGVTSGAIGGVNSLLGSRIAYRDIKDQESQLKEPTSKALNPPTPAGLLRAKTYRRSTIAMRRSPYGAVIPTRRRAGVG